MIKFSLKHEICDNLVFRQEVAAAIVAAYNMQTAHIQTACFTPPPPPSVNSKLAIKYLKF